MESISIFITNERLKIIINKIIVIIQILIKPWSWNHSGQEFFQVHWCSH